jgi:hypothetical protein
MKKETIDIAVRSVGKSAWLKLRVEATQNEKSTGQLLTEIIETHFKKKPS